VARFTEIKVDRVPAWQRASAHGPSRGLAAVIAGRNFSRAVHRLAWAPERAPPQRRAPIDALVERGIAPPLRLGRSRWRAAARARAASNVARGSVIAPALALPSVGASSYAACPRRLGAAAGAPASSSPGVNLGCSRVP
jgi:hypothetical protein